MAGSVLSLGQLLNVINNLPPFGEVSHDELELLSGGQCNVNVRVGQGRHALLVRFLSRADIANPIDRMREFEHQRLAASHSLAPQPLMYYSIEQLQQDDNRVWSKLATQFSGVIVATYCSGTPLALSNEEFLATRSEEPLATRAGRASVSGVASLLATLHQIPYQSAVSGADNSTEHCSLFTRLKHYWQLFSQQYPDDVESYQGLICEVLNDIEAITIDRRCLIHGDVNPGNIIVNDHQIRLIDWEYSDYDDPFIDLASAIVELRLESAERAEFIADYASFCAEVDDGRLMMFESYYCALCWLWSLLQNSQSDDLLIEQPSLPADERSQYYYQRLLRNIARAQ